MNRREELFEQAQRNPAVFVEERLKLEQDLAQTKETIAEQIQTLAEQKSLIEQLKRMLFGPKSEKMTEEQKYELAEVVGDLAEQQERPASDGDNLLQEESETPEAEEKPKRQRKRTPRQIPVNLEVQTTVLEPQDAACEHCGRLGDKIR